MVMLTQHTKNAMFYVLHGEWHFRLKFDSVIVRNSPKSPPSGSVPGFVTASGVVVVVLLCVGVGGVIRALVGTGSANKNSLFKTDAVNCVLCTWWVNNHAKDIVFWWSWCWGGAGTGLFWLLDSPEKNRAKSWHERPKGLNQAELLFVCSDGMLSAFCLAGQHNLGCTRGPPHDKLPPLKKK